MGTFNVKLCDRLIFSKSGNQGNQWSMHQLRLQGTGSKEVRTRLSWYSTQQHTPKHHTNSVKTAYSTEFKMVAVSP